MNSAIQAAIVAVWLCAPALAVNHDMSPSSALPDSTTAQSDKGLIDRDLSGSETRERMREAPAASPGRTTSPRGGVIQGQGRYGRAPAERGANLPLQNAPEARRRWGLIVFVTVVVALGLMAFRRRGPMPPNP